MSALKVVRKDRAGEDPLRAALASKLEAARAARQAADNQTQAVSRAKTVIYKLQQKITTAESDIKDARAAYAADIASATADDTEPPASSGVRSAKRILEDLNEEFEAAVSAHAALKTELPLWQQAAVAAEVAAHQVVSQILEVHARRLVETAREIQRRFLPVKQALIQLVNNDTRAPFSDFLAGERSQKPLETVRAEAMNVIQTRQWVDIQADNPWRIAREQLLADPYAEVNFAALSDAQ
jgi:tRNA A37 N6-isopentenylltransferase MiaA